MYKFHITGYAATEKDISYYHGSCPIDVTVYSDTTANALTKVESVTGQYLSTTNRKIVIEEISDKETPN